MRQDDVGVIVKVALAQAELEQRARLSGVALTSGAAHMSELQDDMNDMDDANNAIFECASDYPAACPDTAHSRVNCVANTFQPSRDPSTGWR